MAIRQSFSKLSRQSKIKRLSGAMAVRIAKERKDPDAMKLERLKKLFYAQKAKVKRKYGSKGMLMAKRIASR